MNDVRDVELHSLFSKLAFHWPLYIVLVFLSLGGGWIYLWYTQPTYMSSAKIYIKDEKKGSGELDALKELPIFSTSKTVENEMEVIKSPLILEDVILAHHFNIRIFNREGLRRRELYNDAPFTLRMLSDSATVSSLVLDLDRGERGTWTVQGKTPKGRFFAPVQVSWDQPFKMGKDNFCISRNAEFADGKSFRVIIDSILPLAYKKADEIGTALVNHQASVFMMTYEDPVPARAADFLNALIATYNRFTLSDKNQIAANTIRFISGRLDSLRTDLDVLEMEEENFKTQRGITEISENARMALDQVKDADQRLGEANIQWSMYDEAERYVNDTGNSAPFTPVAGAADPALSAMIAHYEELITERKRLALSLQPSSNIVQNLNGQISDAGTTIKNYIAGYRRNAGTARKGLQQKVGSVEARIAQIPGYEREYINIKRQQNVKESLYVYLLQKKEESDISYASTIVDNKIISYAFVPDKPISPSKPLIFILFSAAGVILATAYLYIKYLLNNTVQNRKEIEALINAPVMAEIAKQDVIPRNGHTLLHGRSVLHEQVYNLRNGLRFMLGEVTETPVILFVSSISGEGKTFLSSHLGSALTMGGKKAVLLELDLRNPKLSWSLGMSREPGLTNYLIGALPKEQIIREVPENEHLYVISSGPIPPNPIELIEGARMKELLEWLKKRFDYIIIDTAPVGMVSDAKSLSVYADISLFVVRYRYTPKAKLAEVAENMGQSFRRMGVIFNGITAGAGNGYYSYKYYAYGEQQPPKNPIRHLLKQIKERAF